MIFKRVSKNKYNNIFVTVDGIRFHSRLESEFYKIIKKFCKRTFSCGLVYNLQVPFLLSSGPRKIKYLADFVITNGKKKYLVECKGFQTESSKLKMQLFKLIYPEYEIYIGSDINKLKVFLSKIL